MITIHELQSRIFMLAIGKGWWPLKENHPAIKEIDYDKANIPEKFALMHEEISEALRDYRDNYKPGEIYYEDGEGKRYSYEEYQTLQLSSEHNFKPCGISIELADCIIRILDFAAAYNIDMESRILLKHEFNKARPYRHGGKTC